MSALPASIPDDAARAADNRPAATGARAVAAAKPGKAAVVLLARKVTDDKFSAAMSEFGGQVLKSSLSEQDEQELMAELGTPTE